LAGPSDAVTDFFPMKNVDEAAISYFMDPKEQLFVFKQMRQNGVRMNGIFHSHVASEAFPSQKDVRLAFYPDVSYLIVSLSDMKKPVLRSFRIQEEKVAEEEIKIV
jgi:proteasome lid subunit RPN8/RPN11